MEMQMQNEDTSAGRYSVLMTERESFLDRARDCAALTIPTLIPPEGNGKHTRYPTPHQSIGARGVNNLAAKLLLSLFPPNAPFFAMKVDDFTVEEIAQEEGARAKVDQALGKYERSVMQSIEDSGDRAALFEAFKHLIVAGNVLIYLPKSGGIRVFPLSRYVATRDPMGNIIEVIFKEELMYASLPDNIKEMLAVETNPDGKAVEPKNTIEIYTKFCIEGNKIKSYQEVEGLRVPDSEGSWPRDKSPIIALRWTRIDGEDYGRSYVEEYLGDLNALEGLSRSLLEAAAASARLVVLVRPGSQTKVSDITKCPNGGAVSGLKEDVTMLQVDKHADLSVAQNQAREIVDRLSFIFLMNSAVQRNGERVTAEEVRYMAGELEDALGGVYSILSQEFQLPYVVRVIDRLTRQRKLPKLPAGVAKPTITTGLEALGRGHDLSKYDLFLKALQPLGPDAVNSEMNIGDYITRIGTALGIDLDGLVKTQEQKDALQQQAQEAQNQAQLADLAKGAVGPLAKAGAEAVIPNQ